MSVLVFYGCQGAYLITLGEFKTFFATAVAFESLRSTDSIMGQIVHWVATDIIGQAEFWWNRGNDTFDTVDGTAEYFLSPRVYQDKVWGMYDQDNDRKIHKRDLQEFYDSDPTPTEEGDAYCWAYVGQSSCQAVSTAAGTVSVVSSDNDDTSFSAIIQGKVAGIQRYEILELTGATAVTGTLSFAADQALDISVENKPEGVITVTHGSATVASIPPKQRRIRTPHIRFMDVPGTTGDTINYFFYKNAPEPVDDADFIDFDDAAYTALRSGILEVCLLMTNKPDLSFKAHEKYRQDCMDLIIKSERDIAGNPIKQLRDSTPFAYRLPTTISGSVTV